MTILAFLTQLELYDLFERTGLKPMKILGLACGLIIMLGSYYIGIDSGNDLFLLCFLALTLAIIRLDLHAGRLRGFMPTLFGLIYVPFLHFMRALSWQWKRGIPLIRVFSSVFGSLSLLRVRMRVD